MNKNITTKSKNATKIRKNATKTTKKCGQCPKNAFNASILFQKSSECKKCFFNSGTIARCLENTTQEHFLTGLQKLIGGENFALNHSNDKQTAGLGLRQTRFLTREGTTRHDLATTNKNSKKGKEDSGLELTARSSTKAVCCTDNVL